MFSNLWTRSMLKRTPKLLSPSRPRRFQKPITRLTPVSVAGMIWLIPMPSLMRSMNTDATPVDILANVNRVLCQALPQDLPSSIFAAAAAVTIDPTNSTLCIANAGLPHPLYMSRRTGD
ncbi:MAG TPA: hypothetical protein DIT99_27815, partial [Candidatus Latescibacteria bacterium]|nr:hypothetical protein [Candidatus Latescibacterota bacterium]